MAHENERNQQWRDRIRMELAVDDRTFQPKFQTFVKTPMVERRFVEATNSFNFNHKSLLITGMQALGLKQPTDVQLKSRYAHKKRNLVYCGSFDREFSNFKSIDSNKGNLYNDESAKNIRIEFIKKKVNPMIDY